MLSIKTLHQVLSTFTKKKLETSSIFASVSYVYTIANLMATQDNFKIVNSSCGWFRRRRLWMEVRNHVGIQLLPSLAS